MAPTHCVRARTYFYGCKEISQVTFCGTLAECKNYVNRKENSIYYLSHNESGRPTYRIVTVNSLSPKAIEEMQYIATLINQKVGSIG